MKEEEGAGGSFGQAKRRAQANTKAFARYLYNLTSIIMDQVRRFMKFAIVEVVNYAAAMQVSIECLASIEKRSQASFHAIAIPACLTHLLIVSFQQKPPRKGERRRDEYEQREKDDNSSAAAASSRDAGKGLGTSTSSSSSSSAAARKEGKGQGPTKDRKRRRDDSNRRNATKPQCKKQSDFDKLLKEVQDKMAAQRKGQGGSREEQGGRSEGSNWGGGGQHGGGGYGYYNDKAGSSSSGPSSLQNCSKSVYIEQNKQIMQRSNNWRAMLDYADKKCANFTDFNWRRLFFKLGEVTQGAAASCVT